MKRLRLAIAGFTGCSGCQLTLLNCETELVQIAKQFDIDYFPLASSSLPPDHCYDIALLEGCISTDDEIEFLKTIREQSNIVIAMGTCAAWGGIPAMPPLVTSNTDVQAPQPLHALIQVDGTLHGCPPEKHELLDLLANLLRGVVPPTIDYPVCTECKMKENPCLLTENQLLCLGGITLGGCNARCPSRSVPCEGCRGPVPEENLPAALTIFAKHGFDTEAVMHQRSRFFPRHDP